MLLQQTKPRLERYNIEQSKGDIEMVVGVHEP